MERALGAGGSSIPADQLPYRRQEQASALFTSLRWAGPLVQSMPCDRVPVVQGMIGFHL